MRTAYGRGGQAARCAAAERPLLSFGAVTAPGSFSTEDYARRMSRAADAAARAGLTGVLVTPGPDLQYFAGYTPVAITERITLLAIQAGRKPAMIVPVIERPDAEAAPGAGALVMSEWGDGQDPYEATAQLLAPDGRYAISDSAWAMHVLGLQQQLPGSSYVSMTSALPMLRAIKDADELELLASGAAALDAVFGDLLRIRFSGRRELDVASDLADLLREHGHSEVEFTLVGSGPNGANPHHQVSGREIEEGDMVVLDFGGIKGGYASDITRTVHVGEPTAEEREVYDVVARAYTRGSRQCARGRLPGDRPRRADADRRRRLRRPVHPPLRPRDRVDGPRTAVHGRGGDQLAGARDVLLDRAGDLPERAIRRADRGHRDRHRGRRAQPQQHRPRAADRALACRLRAHQPIRLRRCSRWRPSSTNCSPPTRSSSTRTPTSAATRTDSR